MRVGYARVSTTEQNIEAQLERLSDCEKIFEEKLSGSLSDRPEFTHCLEYVRAGDVLVATRLDRLARSVTQLIAMAEMLERKGVELQILDQKIDSTTATGKLLFHLLAAVAEFELGVRNDAILAGMAHARASGKHIGRPYKISADVLKRIRYLAADGYSKAEIARRVKLDRSTVYRVWERATGPTPLGISPESITITTPISEVG